MESQNKHLQQVSPQNIGGQKVAYSLSTRNRNPVVAPKKTMQIEVFLSGYGMPEKNKMFIQWSSPGVINQNSPGELVSSIECATDQDTGAKALMKELAEEELKHSQLLKNLKEKGLGKLDWYREKVPNLMISEYLTGGETLEGAYLQDTLIFAMKREQQSVDFYSRMMGVIIDKDAKHLWQRLVSEELKHKLRLEMFYDDFFYGED